jgi:hypothetical protein
MGLVTETPIEVHSSSAFYGSSPEQLISDISHEPASHSAPERSAANSVVGTNVAPLKAPRGSKRPGTRS